MAVIADTLSRIKRDPLALLGGAERVDQCFKDAGHVWRDCVFTPARTMKLFILQVLNGNTAISHLRHLSGDAEIETKTETDAGTDVAGSSYCEARSRLPLAGV